MLGDQAVSVRTTQAEKILRVSGWRWLPVSALQGLNSLTSLSSAWACLGDRDGDTGPILSGYEHDDIILFGNTH